MRAPEIARIAPFIGRASSITQPVGHALRRCYVSRKQSVQSDAANVISRSTYTVYASSMWRPLLKKTVLCWKRDCRIPLAYADESLGRKCRSACFHSASSHRKFGSLIVELADDVERYAIFRIQQISTEQLDASNAHTTQLRRELADIQPTGIMPVCIEKLV